MVGCLKSQVHARVSQGRICTDNFTCCHTEVQVADPTFYFTQSQQTDTRLTSPSTDPITPGAWQGSHWSAHFEVTGMTPPGKLRSQAEFEPRIFRSRGGRLNREAREGVARNRNTSLPNEQLNRGNSAGHTVTAGRKKKREARLRCVPPRWPSG